MEGYNKMIGEFNRELVVKDLAKKLHQYFSEDTKWILGIINNTYTLGNISINDIIKEAEEKYENLDVDTRDVYIQRAEELFDLIFMD